MQNNFAKKTKIIAIVGPTASGKTLLGKNLAQKFNGTVISVDSRQIYKGLDIGTAKDKSFFQEMIDICEPSLNFSVSDFKDKAEQIIEKLALNGKVPFLVGGTGLYMDAILYGYEIPDLKTESLKLRQELEQLSNEELVNKLLVVDPVSAKNIDHNNKRRLIRALEYSTLANKPFSAEAKKQNPKYSALILGIDIPREKLYAKIDARVDQQIKDGLIEEVRTLISKYPKDLPALNTIGYKEIINYLGGIISLKEAIEQIKFHTHAYVRRQMTWFRRNEDIKWVSTYEEAQKLTKKFLNKK